MWTARPFALLPAMVRSVVAASEAPFQPFEPRLTGTMVSMALPSLETNGPAHLAVHHAGHAAEPEGVSGRLGLVRAGQARLAVIHHDRGEDVG